MGDPLYKVSCGTVSEHIGAADHKMALGFFMLTRKQEDLGKLDTVVWVEGPSGTKYRTRAGFDLKTKEEVSHLAMPPLRGR
jgi:hypothetical protein